MIWNTVSSTDEAGLLYIVRDDGKVQTVPVMLVYRDSVEPGMAPLTLKRFSYACQLLAAGIDWDEDSNACKKVEDLPDWYGDDLPVEPNVQIWVKGTIPVFTNTGVMQMSVNVFTELTSVRNFVYIMRLKAEERQSITDILEEHKPATPEYVEPEHNELDEYFPRDENGQAPTTAPQAPAPQVLPAQPQGGDSESPYLGGYDHKRNEEYATQYGGKTVRFDVMEMKRAFDTRDGSPQVQVCSSYNGSKSRYPAHSLKVKVNRLEKVEDGFTKQILESVLNDGAEVSQAFYGSYFMFTPEPGKLYPLLVKLTPAQPATQQMMAGTPRDEDVPF